MIVRLAQSPIVLAAVVSACSEPPAATSTGASITNGVPDLVDTGVVAILVDGGPFCTGTLVSSRVVVTAAHCVAPIAPNGVAFGIDPVAPDSVANILDFRAHPAHDPASGMHDLAVILLGEPATGIRWWPLNTTALDASWTGATMRLVGYGLTAAGSSEPAIRREGTTVIDRISDTDLFFHASPSQTCTGDSGGPAFMTIAGVEVLAGVVSGGDPACNTMARNARVDIEVANFLAPYLAATSDGAAETGQRCFFAENCTNGRCEVPSDAPHRGYCTAPCGDGVGCPSTMACVAAHCVYPAPSPGALGGACDTNDDCSDAECVRWEGESALSCADRCFPGNEHPCADGFACRLSSDHPGQYFCAAEHGGCSATGSAGPSGLLLLAAALATRRRRRRPTG